MSQYGDKQCSFSVTNIPVLHGEAMTDNYMGIMIV